MARIGRSPLKNVKAAYQPARVTVVVVTCIPMQTGYYAQRLDVLKVCLQSLVKHADVPFDLMVVDNGSCEAVVDYLIQARQNDLVQYLILNTRNMGLGGAWNLAFAGAPGEIISFTNDDIFFYPHWLSKQIEILENFPKAGMVCGQLIQGDGTHEDHVRVAKENGFEAVPFDYPREWLERWCRNIDGEIESTLNSPTVLASRNYIIQKGDMKAFAGANGYAWTFRKGILSELNMFPFPTATLHGRMDECFQGALFRAGYLSYATMERTNDHIGNVMDPFWQEEAKRFDIQPDTLKSPLRSKGWKRLPGVHKAGRALLHFSLKVLQERS